MKIEKDYFDNSKYFDNDKKLKSNYLLYYFSNPHWSDIPRNMEIFITQEYSFEVKLLWFKFPLKKRLYSQYSSNLLPENIIELLKEINEFENIKLLRLYSSRIEKYAPEGLSNDSYIFNHKSKLIEINMSSYWTDRKLFITKEEKLFLKLHLELEKWKEELYNNITKLHA